jgi:hypothetical protein
MTLNVETIITVILMAFVFLTYVTTIMIVFRAIAATNLVYVFDVRIWHASVVLIAVKAGDVTQKQVNANWQAVRGIPIAILAFIAIWMMGTVRK